MKKLCCSWQIRGQRIDDKCQLNRRLYCSATDNLICFPTLSDEARKLCPGRRKWLVEAASGRLRKPSPRLTNAAVSPYMRGGGVAPKGAAPASLRAWASFRRGAVSRDALGGFAKRNEKFRYAIRGLRKRSSGFRSAEKSGGPSASPRAENDSEKNLSAKQARSQAPPRVQGAHEDGRRPQGDRRPPRPRPQAPLGVIRGSRALARGA